MNYVPLHIHTGYTFLSSSLRIEDLITICKRDAFSYIGISDFNNAYAYPCFYHQCIKNNIHPLFGISLNIEFNKTDFYICLYINDELGYKNICKLQSYEKISQKTLLEHSKGLTLVVPCISNKLIRSLLINKDQKLSSLLLSLKGEFNDIYLGIEIYCKDDENVMNIARDYAFSHTYKTLCFPKHLYKNKNDALEIKILNAIKNNEKLDSFEEENGPYYFLNEKAVNTLYLKNEIENTLKLASSISFDFNKSRGTLYKYPISINPKELIYSKSIKRLKELSLYNDTYISRLNYELDIIEKMGFLDYFLIVQDYVNYAKNSDIPVGPGRGSSAGSLVSYCLNITEVDPIKYGLYFERFLNPGRTSLPDIDIDIADNSRNQVIDYVFSHFGEKKTANIVTFQTIGAKQAIRDIGRVFSFNQIDINTLAKMLSNNKTLEEEKLNNDELKELVSDNYFARIFNLAKMIEGLPRQSGLHAAGIIINNTELEDIIPTKKSEDNKLICQYESIYLEEQGFLKMDILGLRNLSLIRSMENRLPSQIQISLDDEKTFKILSKGLTKGIFQLESEGMKNALKEVKIKSFDDIVALLALYRPGPMEFIKDYALNKNTNKQINYINSTLEEILKPTYGVIIYQEQIIKIAQKVALFTLSEADLFRRAISKKNEDKLIELKNSFISGALKNQYSYDEANKIFNLIEKFANYGFNKSHSVAYALITYKMAYIKANYPEVFFASLLDYLSLSDNKYTQINQEMKYFTIQLELPSINQSSQNYIINGKKLLIPLIGIKGLPINSVEDILNERDSIGLFKNLNDFISRMFKYHITLSQINTLIDSGAFDEFKYNRNTLKHQAKTIFEYVNKDLYHLANLSKEEQELLLPAVEIYKEDELEKLQNEVSTLGILLSGSFFYKYQNALKGKNIYPIEKILNSTSYHNIGVIVKDVKTIQTKQKQTMAFVTAFDDSMEISLTVFSRYYDLYKHLLFKGNVLCVQGRISFDEIKGYSFIVSKIENIKEDK
ncbi:MAG: DNA polymerase III subunit alpha [Bacillales bacterium]|nr:DNA polymerase III subunit alpha [Bacillales bacterium]